MTTARNGRDATKVKEPAWLEKAIVCRILSVIMEEKNRLRFATKKPTAVLT
ncbi:MAG: hypothetical protein QXW70_02970 [Candidatus Anstonellales archaeon]